MKNYFRNYDQLTGHGCAQARRVALDCLNRALEAADTYQGTRRAIRLEGDRLFAGDRVFDLSGNGRIYVVGAGKGSFPIALALDDLLGERITRGIVLVKAMEERSPRFITMMLAGHPVPDERSLQGGLAIRDIASQVREGDLVFACLTGGCSALMVLPAEGITLEDKIAVNRLLLTTGAPISEMNAVRKHLSRIKGGGLVKLFQAATVITLTQDTAPDALPWPDPALPDPSTFADAVLVLKNYDLWERVPEDIRRHLLRGMEDAGLETPKSFEGIDTLLFDTANPRDACLAAVAHARNLGYHAEVLSTRIEGESRDVGTALAGIAKEIHRYGRPFPRPCVLVSAGETTVALRGPAGEGGPNQELILGFARSIQGYEGVAAASIDSEGTDGPTAIAGAIADGESGRRARELSLDLFGALKRHDSSPLLRALGDAIITGPTGTNVVNLRVIVVEKGEESHGPVHD